MKFEEMEIPHEYLKFVIGKKAHNIHKLKSDHGVEVITPFEDDETQTVLLAGPSNPIKQVREILTALIKEKVSFFAFYISFSFSWPDF